VENKRLQPPTPIPYPQEAGISSFLEQLPVAAFTCDASGRISSYNQRAAQLLGRMPKLNDPVDRFCGSCQLFSPDGSRIALDQLGKPQTLATKQEDQGCEVIIVRPDGGQSTILVRAKPILDETGKFLGIVHVLTDITSHKCAEEALRETVQLDRQIITSAHEGIVVQDSEFRYVSWNPFMVEMTGLPVEAVVGKLPWDLFPFLEEQHWDLMRRALAGETVTSPDVYYDLPQTGRSGWASARLGPLRDARGRCVGVISTVHEITERKKAEELLRESEARFRTFVDHATDALFLHGPGGIVVDVNRQACESLGYTREELIGMTPLAFDSDATPEGLAQLAGRLEAGEAVTFDSRHRRKNGTLFPVEIRIRPFVSDGRVFRIALARDITARKQAEEERRKLEEQMRHAQKLESLGVLAGGIAHDFNNLLTSVLGYASMAAKELPLESAARPMLEEVEKAAQRAAELTHQMLAYAGHGKFVVQALRLDPLVREIGQLLHTVVSRNAVLELDLAPAPIEGDPTQVRQIVMNLLTNASDALAGEPGVITVRTGTRLMDAGALRSPFLRHEMPAGEYAYLEVVDNGCGMDKETLGKIFDPFFTTKFTGRGLGLAAVLGIVRGHRGSLQVASAPGQGTTVLVFFPAVAEDPRASAEASPAEARSHGNGTILVVDDEENVRSFAGCALEAAGFRVLLADDGLQGIEMFRAHQHEIQAVVLDLTMPRMDGWEVAERLQSLRSDVPILLMSGFSDQKRPAPYEKVRLAGFLPKPFRPHDLIAQVGQIAQRSGPSAGP
jgi:PAS domain S-box-containing protein